jgi:hypothetical protein
MEPSIASVTLDGLETKMATLRTFAHEDVALLYLVICVVGPRQYVVSSRSHYRRGIGGNTRVAQIDAMQSA